jgi:hypothetical protein
LPRRPSAEERGQQKPRRREADLIARRDKQKGALIADLRVGLEAANLQHIAEGRQIDQGLSARKQQMKELEVESDSMKSDYQRMLNEKNSRLTSALSELVNLLNSIVGKRPSLGTRFDLHFKWWWTGRK